MMKKIPMVAREWIAKNQKRKKKKKMKTSPMIKMVIEEFSPQELIEILLHPKPKKKIYQVRSF